MPRSYKQSYYLQPTKVIRYKNPAKRDEIIKWIKLHHPAKNEIPEKLLYREWYLDVYLYLSEKALNRNDADAKALLSQLHEGVFINAIFCWASHLPQAPDDAQCIVCKKGYRCGDPIAQICDSHPKQGMHMMCMLDNILQQCPCCGRYLFTVEEIGKYCFDRVKIDNLNCYLSIAHNSNGERRMKYTGPTGVTRIVNCAEDYLAVFNDSKGHNDVEDDLYDYVLNHHITKPSDIEPKMRFKEWLKTLCTNKDNKLSGSKLLEIFTVYIIPAVQQYVHNIPIYQPADATEKEVPCCVCKQLTTIRKTCGWSYVFCHAEDEVANDYQHNHGICTTCCMRLISDAAISNKQAECPTCHNVLFDPDNYNDLEQYT